MNNRLIIIYKGSKISIIGEYEFPVIDDDAFISILESKITNFVNDYCEAENRVLEKEIFDKDTNFIKL